LLPHCLLPDVVLLLDEFSQKNVPLLGRHTSRSLLRSASKSTLTRSRTNNAAALVAVLPCAFVKTQRYCLPLSKRSAANDRLTDVAPAMSLQLTPPLRLTCHCAVAPGLAIAFADKKSVVPVSSVVDGAGCSVIVGGPTGMVTVNSAAAV